MTRFEALQIIAANLPETLYDKSSVNVLDEETAEEVQNVLDKFIAQEARVINKRAEEKESRRVLRERVINNIRPRVHTLLNNGPMTVKEMYEKDGYFHNVLGWKMGSLQYALLNDLRYEIIAQPHGRKPYTYALKEEGV